MYSDRQPKNFAEALRYYERAALVLPSSGNAQNQVSLLKLHFLLVLILIDIILLS